MPDKTNKRELYGDILKFDEYVAEINNRVSAYDQEDLTLIEADTLKLYKDLLVALQHTSSLISVAWDV